MKKGKKGFVVSAVLYPLLVLFLAIIMGLLSMTDTRKRILDKMKLEITDNIFDDAACSCDTILAKLNYIIANGTGGSGGGDTGSYAYNKVTLNVKTYESLGDFPVVGNIVGDIAVISSTPVKNYYVSSVLPKSPQEGTVWIVQDRNSEYFITSDWNKIGVSYVMQYENGIWNIKKSYIYTGESWQMLYYVPVSNGEIDLASSDINAKIEYTYDYTGKYQVFHAPFSGTYEVELWGAQGGYYNASQAAYGGKGAHTKGTIYLDAGTALYLYIGGQGGTGYYDSDISSTLAAGSKKSSGGWNGGGYGTYRNTSSFGNGGGGATDIRIVPTTKDTIWDEFDSLKSRIMVAAGGGGKSYDGSNHLFGGAGGGLNGSDGHRDNITLTYFNAANGGTQSAGGSKVIHFTSANDTSNSGGSFGKGGNGSYNFTSGGGSGYFGGGGGGHNYNDGYIAGGGGSSYISGYDGCNSIAEESTENNIIMSGSAYHYAISVADGNNSTTKKSYYFKDGLMEGDINSGNGSAKITLKSIEVRTSEKVAELQKDSETTWTYGYSGNYQKFVVPVSGTYRMQLYGASGGASHYSLKNYEGKGAYTEGNIYLKEGTTLYVYVGGKGGDGYATSSGWTGYSTYYSKGGYNGGGNGTYYNNSNWGNGGGGATDVRLVNGSVFGFDSLKSRIMVAGGGGGFGSILSGSTQELHYGGDGGGLNGIAGHIKDVSLTYFNAQNYGTQSSGGEAVFRADDSKYTGEDGSFGQGGDGAYLNSSGGGGGYYGGGGGGHNYNDGYITGGGGSSYISGHAGCNSISEDSTVSKINMSGASYHYSGYYYINTKMSDGINEGNGKAIFTLIDRSKQSDDTMENRKFDYNKVWTYEYNGNYQTFTAPVSGEYKVQLYGASGGASHYSLKAYEGKGGYTEGVIYLNKGTSLYVYVGGKGGDGYYDASGWTGYSTYYSKGGYNGGGNGTFNNTSTWGNGGGGATDVRLVSGNAKSFEGLKSRIMVAAGGSGVVSTRSGDNQEYYYGASGGGLTGNSGNRKTTNIDFLNALNGATQTLGGQGVRFYWGLTDTGSTNNSGKNGSFGQGGDGAYNNSSGGGGGYFGGGGGGHNYNDGYITGGGGSSYISGYEGCNSIVESSTENNIDYTGSAYHYSGYYFTDTSMKSGVQEGNGKAVITLVEEKTVSTETITNNRKNNDKVWTYDYAGKYQYFTAPVSGTYEIDLYGASGGAYHYSISSYAGKGAQTSGKIYLNAGTKLYVYVGGKGSDGYYSAMLNGASPTNYISSGGYNGGGNGSYGSTNNFGNGGGGATDIRIVSGDTDDFDSLKSRIMVAGGGAGTEYSGKHSYGGSAGGLVGESGHYSTDTTIHVNSSVGGSQTIGGTGTIHGLSNQNHIGKSGSFGKGGNGSYYYSSGGGGGYYGGGGGGHNNSTNYISGAGGSSYISGYSGCNSIKESSTESNIIHTGSAYHYSGYYFTEGSMDKNETIGNGKAIITLVSTTEKDKDTISNYVKSTENEWNFTFSKNYQEFTAPVSGTYSVTLNGAEGGYYDNSTQQYAGKGATTTGDIYLTEGTKLYIYVGGHGGNGNNDTSVNAELASGKYISSGGYNGGGNGSYGSTSNFVLGGGGSTDIRTVSTDSLTTWNENDSLKSRIMVAAGGGGVGYTGSWNYGASGGGLKGYEGRYKDSLTIYDNTSQGGTQIAGGKGTYRVASPLNHSGNDGGFGFGGTGAYYHSPGGGSGWYGGGGGGYTDSVGWTSAAGGSSYISGHNGCIGVNSSGTPLKSTASSKADSYSWTNFIFTNTEMIDGRGYSWTTTVSSSSTGMPNYSGSGTMTGNLGNGYARITYLGA